MNDAAEISDACDYYRKILPFYEKESVARAHLDFWRGLARELAPRRILEIGAGLGRVTAELARVAPAVGLDVSLEMLAAARRREPRATFVAARDRRAAFVAARDRRAAFIAASDRRAAFIAASDRRAAFIAADARRAAFGRVFDLIVAPGDPISHLTTAADRRRALSAIARQLSPGGTFVLEGLHRRPGREAQPRRRIRHRDGVLTITESWLPLGVRDLWHARYRYRDEGRDGSIRSGAAAFLARAWDPASIREVFRSSGLEIRSLWGDFDGRPFRPGAPRLVVTARLASRRLPRGGTRPAALI